MLSLAAAVLGMATIAAAQDARSTVERPAGVSLETLARSAEEAWAAGRTEDALASFRAGLELDPSWREGWWRVAQIHASAARYGEAKAALLRLVALEPDAGPAWALLGLCERGLGAYDRALAYLWKGTSLGVEDDALGREARLHFGLLLVRAGDFGSASRALARLAVGSCEDTRLQDACGLLALRRQQLPDETGEDERALVRAAGQPSCAALALKLEEAQRGFAQLVAQHPRARGVHFLYGTFLRGQALPGGLEQLQEEVRLFPDNAEAQAEIAFEILERGEPAGALDPARAAVRLSPDMGRGRLALGRALVATRSVEDGIAELELAARLLPDSADVYLALAQAYAAAGRTADVARARARLSEIHLRRGSGP
jgi:predicted Zn-dependent protease